MALVAAWASGCAGPAAQDAPVDASAEPDMTPLSGGVAEGELALTLGDPVRAIRLLEAVEQSDDTYAYAQELLEEARADADAVIQAWLVEIGRLIEQGEYQNARVRGQALVQSFPLRPEQRDEAQELFARLDQAIEAGRARLADTEKQARDLLLSHDFESAIRTLKGSLPLAWEVDRTRALAWERMVVAAELRYREALAEGILARESDGDRRRRSRRRTKPGATPTPEPAVEAAPDPAAAEREAQIQSLLAQGRQAASRNAYFDAIKAYEAARALDPKNGDAQAALQALAPRRQQLVKELLARADQYFLRQDLESAVPYYKKVLVLEPENKRAIEGLRMHENLQKIKRGNRR